MNAPRGGCLRNTMENHSLTSKGESLLPLRLLNNPIDETVLTVNGDERVFVGGKGYNSRTLVLDKCQTLSHVFA